MKVKIAWSLGLPALARRRVTLSTEMTAEKQALIKWKSYVARAKKIHSRMTKNRLEIAALAVQACDIKLGGGAHWSGFKDICTLHKFAHDVGIHYKTLHMWVKVYRRIKTQIPPKDWDENNWPAAVRTVNRITAKTPPKEVASIYKQERLKNGEALSLVVISKRMTTYATALVGFEPAELAALDLAEVALASAAINEWAEAELKRRNASGSLNLSEQQREKLLQRVKYFETGMRRTLPEKRPH
jgi:hypothetical protein